MSSLAELQRTFHDCLRARDMEKVEPFVVSTAEITATERLAVYRGNVYVLLHEVLTETFARVQALVGKECFKALAYRFISEHPPQSGCLLEYGREFAGFVAQIPQLEDYPYLSDVARLEWLLNEAYYAEDAPEGVSVNLQAVDAEQIPLLQVQFPPATYFLQSKFPLREIWELASGEREDTVNMGAGGDQVLVIRPEWATQVYWLDPAAYEFLQALYAGNTFERAYVQASKIDSGFDLQGMLVTCLNNRYFLSIKQKKL
ncbi:MAG: DNA-binding domain-containing protein [Pseudomonadota bacterium]